jgi:proteasome lid subunit RPN8/RPN11
VTSATAALYISAPVVDAIIAHARRDAPHECCGLLVGSQDRVDDCVPTTNVAATPLTRYEVAPIEHIRLNRQLRGSGREVVGVYHSHPRGPATPSISDVEEAFYPDFVFLIVSLADPQSVEVRAFEIRDARFILRSFRSS